MTTKAKGVPKAKKKCDKCGFYYGINIFKIHYEKCNGLPTRRENIPFTPRPCKYCKKLIESNKMSSHVINCDKNPRINEIIKSKHDKISKKQTGVQLSDKHKQAISIGRIKYLKENPDRVPYKLNHHSHGPSFPEQYFIDLFKAEKIDLKYHLQIGLYELDFYNEALKKYIEIDGEQHYCDKRIIESDIRRTKFLYDLGWIGIRIRWSEYQQLNFEDRHKQLEEIKKFLTTDR